MPPCGGIGEGPFQRGVTIGEVSEQFGVDGKIVRRCARAAAAQALMRERPARTSETTPHRPYLVRRWSEECDNA
ncbi:hypothetical protein [Streptomyces silvisoli]|uniref:Uncharacterized protein n=1 Tax=Streptomyces silvisoli TaxID=3034235 RepID=A0ABT5ZVK9_9ACTN|nr:hypothetical protein [Streptomyces silvisoli]MDF3293866.1 hypothetical protein [Streptomyces silvisoli]